MRHWQIVPMKSPIGSAAAIALAILSVPSAARAGSAQLEGQAHDGPRAYHVMCRREPSLCAGDALAGAAPGAGPAAILTPALRAELSAVNAEVNGRLRPVADADRHGVPDHWTAGRAAGDCEDYMIAKKQALMAVGWAPDQLLYAVVEGVETPYHAVLVVRTDQGDLVLDNLRAGIVPWELTGYRFVVRQSAADPRRWVRVRPSMGLAASSARRD